MHLYSSILLGTAVGATDFLAPARNATEHSPLLVSSMTHHADSSMVVPAPDTKPGRSPTTSGPTLMRDRSILSTVPRPADRPCPSLETFVPYDVTLTTAFMVVG